MRNNYAINATLPGIAKIDLKKWKNWHWQLANRFDNASKITEFFPGIGKAEEKEYEEYRKKYNIGLTPYLLSLIEFDEHGNPKPRDPIWNQFKYLHSSEMRGMTDYNGKNVNWEKRTEFPTQIIQHKYPDRAIIRVVDSCFGHCNYCYLTYRILDRSRKSKTGLGEDIWKNTIRYLRNNPRIKDVLISGGDPLIISNKKLYRILSDLRSVTSIETIRLNTRALTFLPYRFDIELISIFKKFRLTVLEVHFSHPRELTSAVDEVLELFETEGYRPMLLNRCPLLKGVNDSSEILEKLFTGLYSRRISPYYLFHYAPYALGRTHYGLSVRKGCELLLPLRRTIPGPAFPRYCLFHIDGKQDIPLELKSTPKFKYEMNNGTPVIVFKNWKGNWVKYPDLPYEK